MNKYELTDQTIKVGDHTLYRIRALVNICDDVKEGDLGGYVELETNLSNIGQCWVYGDAWVYGNAQVCGNARVYGNAWVYGDALVYGDARVCGDAQVCGDARVYGNAWKVSPLYIQGTKWTVCMVDATHIKIGCQVHSITDWIKHGRGIARRNHADDVINEYKLYVYTAAMRYGSDEDKRLACELLEAGDNDD